MNLPTEIYSVASVRSIDQAAINDAGIGGYALMMRAGEAAVTAALDAYPGTKRWQVICGTGNNGGDGYVVARLAAEREIAVSVISVSSPANLTGDAAKAYMDFAALGGESAEFAGTLDIDAELLFDGLLGSGLERPVEGRFAELVNAMNDHPASVVALDIPSGIHGDTGAVMGAAVSADLTVTFVGLKSGLFLASGPDHTGTLRYCDLAIPDDCRRTEEPILRRIDDDSVHKLLLPRPRNAHKGDFGHVLVVGGGPGMPGAVTLCGEAALRSGAGLVTIATHPSHSTLIPISRPELMCHGIETPGDLEPLVDKATVVVIGPGLGTDSWAESLLAIVLASDRPVVADADALSLIAKGGQPGRHWILTPHPGEAARLLGTKASDVQAQRRKTLVALSAKYGGTIVLKGAGTLVSSASGAPWLCSSGNPGMASPGMGDALAGIIAAFLAQGLGDETAAVAGVQIHAAAGDRAAISGERGMIASDLIAQIRQQVNK
ncbi:MAG: NAD(P)H-hydrate dehydratase [Proteobacteria bacterium]|nr:NAD(P)H-hydrate dehydratase [Pseudomonadota bacterium]